MTDFGLRLFERVHGHLGWLATLALVHPTLLLRSPYRRAPLAAALATGLVTLAGVLGACLYPSYRAHVKPALFAASGAFGNAFERKEHLAVAAVVLAWVGLVAHLTEHRGRRAQAGSARLAFVAYFAAAGLAVLSASLGLLVAAFRSF